MGTNDTILSVVLGTYNRKYFLKLTIESVRSELARCGCESEIIVVDGGSSDGTIQWLTKQKDIVSIIQHNRGVWKGKEIRRRSWGYFMNLAFKSARGKYVCMVSDDCIVVQNCIVEGLNVIQDLEKKGEKIGAVPFPFTLFYPDTSDYILLSVYGKQYVNHGIFCRSALEDVGFCDENTYQFYMSDVDLCWKIMHAGYSIESSRSSKILHFGSINENIRKSNNSLEADISAFHQKWKHFIENAKEDLNGMILVDKVRKDDIMQNPIKLKIARYYYKYLK